MKVSSSRTGSIRRHMSACLDQKQSSVSLREFSKGTQEKPGKLREFQRLFDEHPVSACSLSVCIWSLIAPLLFPLSQMKWPPVGTWSSKASRGRFKTWTKGVSLSEKSSLTATRKCGSSLKRRGQRSTTSSMHGTLRKVSAVANGVVCKGAHYSGN